MKSRKKLLIFTLVGAALASLLFVLLVCFILGTPIRAHELLLLLAFGLLLFSVPSYFAIARAVRRTKAASCEGARENIDREEIERMLAVNKRLIFLGRVIAEISHEIIDPLFAIAFSFQVIKEHLPRGNGRVREAAQVVENEINRVRAIARGMHEFTIGDIEEETLADLCAIMEAAIKVIEWSRKKRDTAIVFDRPTRPFPLHCSASSLQQVFLNIIINAIEAMDGKGKLVISISGEDQEYRIDFTDSGPGVADDIKADLFKAFKTTKNGKGVGLGLNICQKIIANHGGSITLDDNCPHGAHFIIKIPKARGGVNQ